MELAQIAHPKFREELIQEAKEQHYIFADQLPPSEEDLIFVEGYKSDMTLKDGRVLEFRPLFPSDEIAYRNFFYSLEAKSIYYRYFYNMRLFSHEVLQEQWASIDYRKNISLIGLIQRGGRKEVMALGTYAQEDEQTAEVAFLVREDFHSQGVATHMLIELQRIAVTNGYTRFSASVLSDNTGMLHVFKKRFPHAKFTHSGSEIRVEMPFEEIDSVSLGV
jgi:RimJ/RimL family protein N-acetyltransferase